MNLTTGEWIPVVREDGRADKVSLSDIFSQGDRIRDLAVQPHERIALMRLLICIAQAALDGPKDHADWKQCLARLPDAGATYLKRWENAFELLGDGKRFLQVPNVVPTPTSANDLPLVSKLDIRLATGSTSTLFDNAGGQPRSFTPEQQSLMLLAFQSFSSAGTLSECFWSGHQTKKSGKTAPGLADRMVHTFLLDRTSLLRTIWLNLLSQEQLRGKQDWGVPVWEAMPRSEDDMSAVNNATLTYLGRLTPVSRSVRLMDDGVRMIWGSALAYPSNSEWRDSAATYYVVRGQNGDEERRLLKASVGRSLWRELWAVSVVARTGRELIGGPLAMENAAEMKGVDVFCGAVIYEGAKSTKLREIAESILHIPEPMFADKGQRLYREGVGCAEHWVRRLQRAVSACRRALKDELDAAAVRKRGVLVKSKAALHYWTAVEQEVPRLLDLVSDPTPLYPDDAAKAKWDATPWGRALARAARAAYDLACPHETPRQMKAYAEGLRALFKPDPAQPTDSENQEETE